MAIALPESFIKSLGEYILELAAVMNCKRFHATHVLPAYGHGSNRHWSQFAPGHEVAKMFVGKIAYDNSGWFEII